MLLHANSKDTRMSNDDSKNTACCFMRLVMAGTKAEPQEPLSDGETDNIVILSTALAGGHPQNAEKSPHKMFLSLESIISYKRA